MCSLDHVKQVAVAGVSEVILFRVIEPIFSNEASSWVQAGYTITDVKNKNIASAREFLSQAAKQLVDQGISARIEVIEAKQPSQYWTMPRRIKLTSLSSVHMEDRVFPAGLLAA